MDSETPLCETQGIAKDFSESGEHLLRVLEKMDVQVFPNEILAIIGPSGCGKSTYARILAGLIPPTEGKIIYHGNQINGLLPNFSLVFQNFALYPWMTVKQNVEIVLKAKDWPKEKIETQTLEAIDMIGLSGFEDAYPREISGGMKQRVGLARALVCNPEILILDEPFSSLDAFTGEVLRKELLNLWENKKSELRSIILISHDVNEVVFLADRILMMESNPGRIRFIMDNKLPRPRDYHTKEFIDLVDQLHDAFVQEEAPADTPAEPLFPLLDANPDEILGLLSNLRRHGESADLYQIGAGKLENYRVWIVVEAAHLLNFVTIDKRTITLTDIGNNILSTDIHNRRLIWKQQLEAIPIFRKTIELLKSHPKLRYKELKDLIHKELPGQDAHEQSKILISWGSYGNLFTYHKLSRTLSLKT